MRSPSRSGRESAMSSPNATLRSSSPLNGTMRSTASSSLTSPTRRLKPEELSKLNDRISRPKDYSMCELEPLHKPHVIPKAQLDTSIDRMYRQAMDTRNRNVTNARQRRDTAEAPKVIKITQEELDDSVKRMYNQTLDRKQRNHEALADRYLFKMPPVHESLEQVRAGTAKGGARSPSPTSRPASPNGAGDTSAAGEPYRPPTRAELVDRLYTQELEGIAKRRDERHKKYVVATEPKMHKADADEISDIIDRLYGGKK